MNHRIYTVSGTLSGTSFCFETVFSHPSKIDFIANAKALGYEVTLVLIHLETSDLNLARVHQRVLAGGHNVPQHKTLTRIPRTLQHVKMAAPLCDSVRVLDNSSSDMPFRPILTIKNGVVTAHVSLVPEWAIFLHHKKN